MARRAEPPPPAAPDPDAWWRPAAGPQPTPRTMLAAQRLRLAVSCKACGHEADADLQALVDRGRADVPVAELRFRCTHCDSRRTNAVIMSKVQPR